MKQSDLFSLNWHDLGKGLLMAILTPVMVIIENSISLGNLTFDWRAIGISAVAGGFAYLVKNFFTKPGV